MEWSGAYLDSGQRESTLTHPRVSRETWLLFASYIFLLVLLPSGTVFGVNFKALAFLPLLVVVFVRSSRSYRFKWQLGGMLVTFAAFVCWAILPSFYPVFTSDMAVSQLKDVITTLVGCWFIRELTQNEEDRRSFLRLVLYSVAFGCFLKGLIFLYSLRSGVSVSDIVDRISALFGVKLMSADMGEMSVRLQFVSDNLLPMCVFAILCLRRKLRIGAVQSLVLMALFIFSSAYTFSRYSWASTGLAIILGIAVSRRDKMHWLYIAAGAGIAALSYNLLATLIAFRFSGELVDSSDNVRVEQIRALKAFFWDAPLFGHGLGTYTTDVVRSLELPYNYEVQLLALPGQVGLVGMLLFAVLLANYYRKAFTFRSGTVAYQLCVLAMLVNFLGAALFNPCLLTSAAAVSFGFLFALAALGSCRTESQVAPSPRPVRFRLIPDLQRSVAEWPG